MPFDPLNPQKTGNRQPVKKPADRNQPPKRRPNPAPRPSSARPASAAPSGRPASARPSGVQKTASATGRVKKPAAASGRVSPSAPQRKKAAAGRGYQPKFAAKTGKKQPDPRIILVLFLVVFAAGLSLFCWKLGEAPESGGETETFPQSTELVTQTPELPQMVSQATITVTGDLLPHKTIYSKGSVIYQDQQSYDFSPIFKYLKGYTDTADYAVANLETTLFGPEKAYSGNPKFNTPDALVDGAKGAGFDLLLTANNHCNDTGIEGVLRTVQVIREKGLKALGTNLDDSEQKYHIQELNGMKIGMLCYTYEDSQNRDQVTFNYNPLPKAQSNLVCAFPKFTNAKSREPFYEKIAGQMAEMRQAGADAIVVFLHWGEEYHLEPSADQRDMAQRLCDLGADVIIGGHPHVVEPVELITGSQDPSHKTVCLYSLGNAFSNQRREEMTTQKSGHTEDGMLFNITFQKYSDDSVYLSQVEVIPTWVNKHMDGEDRREYNILPLEQEKSDQWQTLFAMDEAAYLQAADSYRRTMEIVGAGVTASNEWLTSQLPGQDPAETEMPSIS